MNGPESTPRRRLLGGITGLFVTGTLAGCSGDDEDGGNDPEDDPEAGDDGSTDDGTGSDSGDDENAGETNGGDDDPGENGTDPTETPGNGDADNGGQTETPPRDELDLREANVVGVSVEHEGGDSYRFDVTLHHDDDGEEGYANWWQVESLDGSQLGRRELLHAHSQQPFTRSATIDVPGDTCVVVRGHDQTHGYGGQVMVVDVESGETNTVRQGRERRPIDESHCP